MAKIVVRRAGTVEQEVPLTGDSLAVGRDPTNDVVLVDPSVSRRHARIEKADGGAYRIVDLESGNGIVHQGKRVPSLDLYSGCEVEIGSVTLRVEDLAPAPLLVLVAGGPLRSYPISAGETILGRSPEALIAVPDPLVSSQHLKILRRGNVYALVDLDSENGTRVNGVRVSSKELSQGDQIQVGGLTFFFALDGVVPEPESVKIIHPTHSPAEPAAPRKSAPPPAPAPAASPKAAVAALPSRSLRPLLLAAAGGFVLLFLVVIFLLVRSPDDAAEREFQEVFQAELGAEERARIEQHIGQAREHEAAGNVGLALEQYRKVLVLDATHQQAVAEAARLEEVLVNEAAARAERERLERESMARVAELADRAQALLSQSKFAEARSVLEEARSVAPESEVLRAKLAESYVTEGSQLRSRDPGRARQAFETALQIDPTNDAARRGIGAIDQSRRASRDRERRVEELTTQGMSQLQREEFQRAYASFSAVLELDPDNARAKEFRDQAAQLLEAQVRPMYDEGVRLYNANELARAMAQFHKVLAIQPDHADTRAFLARATERVRSEAIEIYKKAYIYEGLGRLREALDLYRQTVALLPDPKEEYHQKASQRIAELSRKVQ